MSTSRADTIDAGSGDDAISGGGGDDTILAGAGADRIDGGPGADQIDESDVSKVISPDRITCGAGADTVKRPVIADLLEPNCELVRELRRTVSAYPRFAGGVLTFQAPCFAKGAGCIAKVALKRGRTLLGRGRVQRARRESTVRVRVPLTATGRRLAARPGGAAVSVYTAYSLGANPNLCALCWSLRMRSG